MVGTSQMVQWLRIVLPIQRARVPSLGWELRSHLLGSQKKKKKSINPKKTEHSNKDKNKTKMWKRNHGKVSWHRLNMCPSKINILKSNPQCDGIRRWGLWRWEGHESEALKNGISALIKETPESSLSPSASVRLQPSVIQEVSSHQTQNLLVPSSWTSWPPGCEK